MDNRAVGVLDSGVGGVSVLRALTAVLPNERFLYYGDTANAPYGDRSEGDICALAQAAADKLIGQGVKALVIACNTATSAASERLRSALTIPVVGMEPALKPAALAGGPGKILVLATAATLRQDKFQKLMAQYGQEALIAPCPGLMEFAERCELNGEALDEYLKDRLAAFSGETIAGVVLGCTHYVFLRRAIALQLPGVPLYDGNMGTVRRLQALLTEADLLGAGPGSVSFDSSDRAAIPIMARLYEMPLD